MARLMYNNQTDNLVAREDLIKMPTPEPQGPWHNPYPFHKYVDKVTEALENHDFGIVSEEYAITKDNDRLFGVIAIEPSTLSVPNDWGLVVGLRGAHDRMLSRAITLGSRVMVCSNLCFHGDLGVWKTRQTKNIEDRLPGMIDDAISKLPTAASNLVVSFEDYQNKEMTQDEGYAMLTHIYKKRGFTASQLARAIDEWDNPSFDHDGRTVWRLFNAATQALKPTGTSGDMITLQRRAQVVHSIMESYVH